MKKTMNQLSIAVDSVAVLIGIMAWAFIVWAPILAVFLFFLKLRTYGSLYGIVAISSISILAGLILKWLVKGVVERRSLRLFLSALVFLALGVGSLFPPRAARLPLPPLQRMDHSVTGFIFLLCTVILLFGISKSARMPDE